MVKNWQCSSLQPGYEKMPTMYTGKNPDSYFESPKPIEQTHGDYEQMSTQKKIPSLQSFQREDG